MSHTPLHLSAKEILRLHPNLISWLKKKFPNLNESTLKATVYSCEEPACPIEETILEWSDGSQKLILRLPKSLNKISKLDFLLSLEKQQKGMLDKLN